MNNKRFDISGRVALVTGASSGIGAHFSQVLAAEGAEVVACARRTDRLESLAAATADLPGRIVPVTMDVNDKDSVTAAFDQVEATLGCPAIICNNAGIAHTGPFLELEEEDWDRVLDTDLKSVYTIAREGARRMIAADIRGSIINTASILGFGAAPNLSAYAAAKGGVVQLTRAIALDLIRHGIRCNAIAPGWFLTEINEGLFASERGQQYIKMMPARRLGELEELEGALLLLASDAGSFMNGSVVTVDGGHSVQLI
ncbi:MAG: SDR family oxidoreductase [Pseudomonadota bacterium]